MPPPTSRIISEPAPFTCDIEKTLVDIDFKISDCENKEVKIYDKYLGVKQQREEVQNRVNNYDNKILNKNLSYKKRTLNSKIKELVMTNTIPLPKEKQIDKISVVSISELSYEYFTTSTYILLSEKEQEKKPIRNRTPNRHLFLLLFIFTFNLRSVQEHHQQCSILKNLYVVQCFQHEVRIHLCPRFCSIGVFYELLCPITF